MLKFNSVYLTLFFWLLGYTAFAAVESNLKTRIKFDGPITNNTITGNQDICAGTRPANLIGAEPSGGNGNYTFSWEQSTISVSEGFTLINEANLKDYRPEVLTTTTWFRRKVISGENTNVSNVLVVQVTARIENNSISWSPSMCRGTTPPKMEGTMPTGGTNSFIYSWQLSFDGINYFDMFGVDEQEYAPTEIYENGWYRRKVSSGNCTSVSNAVKIKILSTPSPPQVTGNRTICEGTFTTLQAAGGAENYNWFTTPNGGSPVFEGASFTTPPLTQSVTYYVESTNGNCTSTRTPVSVTVEPAISNNTISGNHNVCIGSPTVRIEGSIPTGGSGSFSYQWEISTTSATAGFVPAPGYNLPQDYHPGALHQTTWYRRRVTSGACGPNVSNAVVIQVLAIPTQPAITQQGKTLTASTTGTAYQWTLDGQTLAATSQSIEATASGEYKVRVKGENQCFSVYSAPLQVTLTSAAEEWATSGLHLFPNPSNGIIHLSSSKSLAAVEVAIFNSFGQKVKKEHIQPLKETKSFDFSHLPAGVYLLQIVTETGVYTQRLVLRK